MWEAEVEEFINLKLASTIVRECSLKFFTLSRYATSLMSNSRDEMSSFLIGIIGDVEKEHRAAMLHDNMVLSRLMVHVQHVENCLKKRGVCDATKPKSSY